METLYACIGIPKSDSKPCSIKVVGLEARETAKTFIISEKDMQKFNLPKLLISKKSMGQLDKYGKVCFGLTEFEAVRGFYENQKKIKNKAASQLEKEAEWLQAIKDFCGISK